jgi:PKD repeat protein
MMRSIARTLLLLTAIWFAGCGGCNGNKSAPPPTAAPAADTPVQAAAATPAAANAATPEAPEVDCFVIVDAETDFGPPPLTVHFTTETDCTGSPVTFSWDFGDGSKGGNEPNPTHVYARAGDYIATVSTTAPDGAPVRTKSTSRSTTISPSRDASQARCEGRFPRKVSDHG